MEVSRRRRTRLTEVRPVHPRPLVPYSPPGGSSKLSTEAVLSASRLPKYLDLTGAPRLPESLVSIGPWEG